MTERVESCGGCGADPVFWNATSKRGFTYECQVCGRKVESHIDVDTARRMWNGLNRKAG